VAVTAGSQASFFVLFNIFGGVDSHGELRHIDLPLTPEYIGYADLCATPHALRAARPRFLELADGMFKYAIDFARYAPDARTGAICVSRPTNPTGNVLTAEEIEHLLGLAGEVDVPLIIDNAYGVPFPGIVFTHLTPFYDERVIYCLSLSKLGLPGMRTGIVIARPEWIAHLRSFNAILTLATGSLGAALVTPLFDSGAVLDLVRNHVQPYYVERLAQAVGWLREHLHGVNFRLHKPEGAIFIWLWFPDLPISAADLYARLKRRRVLIIPGHFFFPGLDREWAHRHQCIRLSYAQSPHAVEFGIRVLGEELRAAHTRG
jgi:valine--pyruvate aminotransferase